MSAADDQMVNDLLVAVTLHASSHKGAYLEQVTAATHTFRIWLSFLRATISTHIADAMLDATQATIIEIAGCLSLGLVRPAIFSIRTQIELLLAWVYFNDHPVEWRHIQGHLRDYPMRARLLQYMNNNNERFQPRFQMLLRKRTRRTEDPYGLLSVHVHSSSTFASPQVVPLPALIGGATACSECIEMQVEVGEYLNDTMGAWYADRWVDFPPEVRAAVQARLSAPELKEFCS